MGTILLTDQGIVRDGAVLDYGLVVEESRSRDMASFVISAPGVRAKKPSLSVFSDSPDRGITVQAGDEITLSVTRLEFYCDGVRSCWQFMRCRKSHIACGGVRDLMPMKRGVRPHGEEYRRTLPQGRRLRVLLSRECQLDVHYGWIGGAYKHLSDAGPGRRHSSGRVANTFDFALPRAKGRSGYYDTLNEDGNVLNRDAARNVQGIGLTRKRYRRALPGWSGSSRAAQGGAGTRRCRPRRVGERDVRSLADAFVDTWRRFGTWGNFRAGRDGRRGRIQHESGGAMAIAGLTLAAEYFSPSRLSCDGARGGRFLPRRLCHGGLHVGRLRRHTAEPDSGDGRRPGHVDDHALRGHRRTGLSGAGARTLLPHLCATWVVSFPTACRRIRLWRLGANTHGGGDWASTQNKHGALGLLHAVGRRALQAVPHYGRQELYAELLRDVIHAHAEGIQPNGKITERLTYCDADSRGSRGGGKTGWNETNGALMALEIPGRLHPHGPRGGAMPSTM